MTTKIVTLATIEVVSLRELRVGDSIMYGRRKILIVNIDYQNRIVIAEEPIGELTPFSSYYRVLTCTEVRPMAICPGCGELMESLTDYDDGFCSTRCKDKFEEVIQ